MAEKLKFITELYQNTLDYIFERPENWIDFLSSASFNYKYKFEEQVLIYAQKPNAIACAEIEIWNKKLKRWIRKGAKGIALLDESNGTYGLRHIFDVSDTYDYYGRDFQIWNVEEKYNNRIIENLEANFGELEIKENIEQAIISAVNNSTEDNLQDYLENLKRDKDNSYLEELDDFNVEIEFKKLICNSVINIVLVRSGKNPLNYLEKEDFRKIVDFNTNEVRNILGIAISDISENILRDIQKTIKDIQINEKKINRKIDIINNKGYDNSINNEIQIRGGIEDESRNRISNARGVQSSKISSTNSKTSDIRQIRTNEIELPKELQSSSIFNTSNEQSVTESFNRDTGKRDQEDRNDNRGLEEKREYNGRNEIDESNAVGTTYEQFEEHSRGDNLERTDIHLNSIRNFLTEDERKSKIDFLQDKYVSGILQNTKSLKATRKEIILFFENNLNSKDREEFIKSVFNDEYTEIVVDDERLGYKTYENVLHLWKGSYLNRTAEVYYDWKKVTSYIEGMIMVNDFRDIIKRLPTQSEQLNIIENAEVENAPAFSFTQELIDYNLQLGSHFEDSKYRIFNQFEKSLSVKENIDFLKHEYGIGGISSVHIGTRVGSNHDSKGITLYRGYDNNSPKLFLTWDKVEKRISELIKTDRYLNSKEKEEYSNWLEKQEQKIQLKENESFEEKTLNFPKKYEYHLGDTVYIGADEYEIASIDEKEVLLYDPQFPLFNKQMDFSEFERKVQENQANDYLITKESTEKDKNEKQEIKEEIQLNANIKPITIVKNRRKIQDFILHPEVAENNRHNYKIIDNELGVGTPKEKFVRNIDAIKVLKKCENENRYANLDEQEILSKYVGWGGLQQAFDENNTSWSNEYLELKNLLNDEEYKQSRASTLTAFYTPPVVIKSIYKALQNMGLKDANILEPSCRSWKLFWNVTK
jgi:hypothetical protein